DIMVDTTHATADCRATHQHFVRRTDHRPAITACIHQSAMTKAGIIHKPAFFYSTTGFSTFMLHNIDWLSLAASVFGNRDDGDQSVIRPDTMQSGNQSDRVASVGSPGLRARSAGNESTKRTQSCQNGSHSAASPGWPIARTNPLGHPMRTI